MILFCRPRKHKGIQSATRCTPDNDPSKSVQPKDTPKPETQSGQTASGSSLVVQPPVNPGNPKDRRKRKTPWWEKAAVIIAFGLLVITWYQGCQTKKAANAAKSAAETAAKQEASWEVSQRPWIEISNPSVVQQQTVPPIVPITSFQPMLQNAEYSFAFVIKVYGSTPALHSYGKSNPRFVTFPSVVYPFMANVTPPSLDSCSQAAKWEDGTSAFFPGGSYPIRSNGQITSAEDMEKLIHAREALFWVGCVRYEDAFHRRYQTNFCFYWSVMEHPLGWARCLMGNELIEYPTETQTK